MIPLCKHIELLLTQHNCVIVPNLGGFIAQTVSAKYIEDAHLFYPPYTTVMFNPHLKADDGLLMDAYMRAYKVSFDDAAYMIEDDVDDLRRELREEGHCELPGIGTLHKGLDGSYSFEPLTAGMAAPKFYGLDAFAPAAVEQVEEERKVPFTAISADKHHYTISLNREFVNYVAAAVVAFVFYFVWAFPGVGTSNDSRQTAGIVQSQSLLKSAPAAATRLPQAQAQAQEAAGKYAIVIGCAIPEANAQMLIDQLRGDGFDKGTICKTESMLYVFYGTYAEKDAAVSAMRDLRGQHKLFKNCWILERE